MPTLVGSSPFNTQTIQSFNTFSGADIVAAIGDKVFGNIQAITYAVQREVAPIYVMGSAECVAYARGKRAITGSLVFIVFDRDALLAHVRGQLKDQNIGLRISPLRALALDTNGGKWGNQILQAALDAPQNFSNSLSQASQLETHLRYVDQVPPFDITISFLNEMGNMAHMRIEGVQLLNEGMGMSIDDVVLEKACTFVARGIKPLTENLTP